MKDRIRRFYEDHKTAVTVTAGAIAAVAIVSMRNERGHKIVRVEDFMRSDGKQAIVIYKKNGDHTCFTNMQSGT